MKPSVNLSLYPASYPNATRCTLASLQPLPFTLHPMPLNHSFLCLESPSPPPYPQLCLTISNMVPTPSSDVTFGFPTPTGPDAFSPYCQIKIRALAVLHITSLLNPLSLPGDKPGSKGCV